MLADFLTVIPQTPSLVLVTYRPEYQGALTRLPGAQTIALAPLRDSEATALITGLLGPDPSIGELAQSIADRAAGNPFFAEEIVRELAERGVLHGKPGAYVSTADVAEVSVPATLQTTIAARIDRLDQKAKRTLSAASVIGSRFGLDLVTALGVEPAVADLMAAQLVDQVRFTRIPEFVFRNPVIRAVAYESQLKSDRAELHRRLAAAIEEHGSADENAALIAEHLASPQGSCAPPIAGSYARPPGPVDAISARHGSTGNVRAASPRRYRAAIRSGRRCSSRRKRSCARRHGGSVGTSLTLGFDELRKLCESVERRPLAGDRHVRADSMGWSFNIGTAKRRCWRPNSSPCSRTARTRSRRSASSMGP